MSKITSNELSLVRNSWNSFRADIPINGSDMFVRLFAKQPSYKAWFKTFDFNEPIQGNKEVIRVATGDFVFITKALENIDVNGDAFNKMLTRLSVTHKKRKISENMFYVFAQVLMEEMTDKLGAHVMDDDTKNAWAKFFGSMMAIIAPGL